jgi:hypothetical protein
VGKADKRPQQNRPITTAATWPPAPTIAENTM